MKSIWNDVILAESDRTVEVEGNHYFPPDSLHREYFRESDTHTICPWKGTARDHVAFWNGIQVVD